MSGETFTRVVCPECNNDDRGLGALPCGHCSGGYVYTKAATPPGYEPVPEGTMELLDAAIAFIDAHPCDPDITEKQTRAYVNYIAILRTYRTTQKETPNAQG